MFFKTFFFIFFLFFLFFLSLLNHFFFFSFSSFFSFSLEEKILPIFFGFSLDKISFLFLMMVCLVTSLVFLYSEVYMEHYSNKKFFFITFSFFSFMVLLALGSSFMNIMIGWDGLGISSLFLIMFYPNKITFFNSFLTFFFNRLGDMLFLIFFCYYLSNYGLFFNLGNFENFFFLLLFFLSLMTKSAQFPFSSWLPAAMSAPTPISAMVHSSTLVTAGILILFKFSFFFSDLIFFLCIVSIVTFLLGGLLGAIEIDLKKVVAFSTMSQISMILFFISLSLFSFAFLHTFGHALFKTLLFCSCGLMFLFNYSDQLSKNIGSFNFNFSSIFIFILSIYAMSGMIFSSSFYTKDLVLEILLENKSFFLIFLMVLGSLLTLIYSCKIFSVLSFSSFYKSFFSLKSSQFMFLFFFSFFLIFSLKVFLEFTFYKFFCLISKFEIFFLNLLIFSFFFVKFNWMKFLKISSLEILFLKQFSFGIFNKFSLKSLDPIFIVDSLYFKPGNMYFLSLNNNFFYSIKFWIFPSILIFIFKFFNFF